MSFPRKRESRVVCAKTLGPRFRGDDTLRAIGEPRHFGRLSMMRLALPTERSTPPGSASRTVEVTPM